MNRDNPWVKMYVTEALAAYKAELIEKVQGMINAHTDCDYADHIDKNDVLSLLREDPKTCAFGDKCTAGCKPTNELKA
jgi:hypothetical protein